MSNAKQAESHELVFESGSYLLTFLLAMLGTTVLLWPVKYYGQQAGYLILFIVSIVMSVLVILGYYYLFYGRDLADNRLAYTFLAVGIGSLIAVLFTFNNEEICLRAD